MLSLSKIWVGLYTLFCQRLESPFNRNIVKVSTCNACHVE